jgi:hypothetical protein
MDLLYQQIAHSLQMTASRIKEAAEECGGGVRFPCLPHIGKLCFDVLTDVKLMFEVIQADRRAWTRLANEFDRRKAMIPIDLQPYFVLYFHTPFFQACVYEGFSYEGEGALIWKTTANPYSGYILEPWEHWFPTVNKANYRSDNEKPS